MPRSNGIRFGDQLDRRRRVRGEADDVRRRVGIEEVAARAARARVDHLGAGARRRACSECGLPNTDRRAAARDARGELRFGVQRAAGVVEIGEAAARRGARTRARADRRRTSRRRTRAASASACRPGGRLHRVRGLCRRDRRLRRRRPPRRARAPRSPASAATGARVTSPPPRLRRFGEAGPSAHPRRFGPPPRLGFGGTSVVRDARSRRTRPAPSGRRAAPRRRTAGAAVAAASTRGRAPLS